LFYIKFVSNYKLQTKIIILSELSLLGEIGIIIVILLKNKKISISDFLDLRSKEMFSTIIAEKIR